MKSVETVCKVCGVEGELTRVPSIPTYFKKNNAGSVVKKHIEDAKEQISEDKKHMRREYK
tara:strand:- start:963 stop:1142 length:180 start_codon:yes stop_codon:yes gene_type:complete